MFFRYCTFRYFLYRSFFGEFWESNSYENPPEPQQNTQNKVDTQNTDAHDEKNIHTIHKTVVQGLEISLLPPEQKELLKKYDTLFEQLSNDRNFLQKTLEILDTNMDQLENSDDHDDPSKHEIMMKIFRLNLDIRALDQQLTNIIRLHETFPYLDFDTITPEQLTVLETLSSQEFLNIPRENRLKFVTVGNITSASILSWENTSFECSFVFSEHMNRDLHFNTTLSQLLPDQIRSIQINGVIYERTGILGEFFSPTWDRARITEATVVHIKKIAPVEELQDILQKYEKDVKEYEWTVYYNLAKQAADNGYHPKFICEVMQPYFTPPDDISGIHEITFTHLAQLQDNFIYQERNTMPSRNRWKVHIQVYDEQGRPHPKFTGYIMHSFANIDPEKLKTFANIPEIPKINIRWLPIQEENINIPDCDEDTLRELFLQKEFPPHHPNTKRLFQAACQAAGIGVADEWWNNKNLHRLLNKESWGVVGCLNYTMTRKKQKNPIDADQFRTAAINSTLRNPTKHLSTASGLGQMILTNVDAYYPDGRRGIGDPLNEAVGMIRYIYDVYGDPTTAYSMHGKDGQFRNTRTNHMQRKWHAEWY